MAEAVSPTLAPAQEQDPDDAPLDAGAIRSLVEQLSLKWRRLGGGEEEVDPAEAEAARGLDSFYEAPQEAMDEWDASSAAVSTDDLDAYLERLRKEVILAEEGNRKVYDEIAAVGEKAANDAIQLDVDIEALEYSLWKLDSEGLSHFEASPIVGMSESTDSCRSQSVVDKDYKYEVLGLDHQIRKSEMDLKLLQNLQRVDVMCQFESMLLPSVGRVLDFKDNCLSVFLKAPILTSDCVLYGQKLDRSVDSLISDHELLIEVDENMEPKKVQIFPDDVCVDVLTERLKSSREVISSPTMGWLIQQFQHHIIVNALRRSLVNDANNSRHSFEYFDKDETVVAHLVRGVDVFIKTSADWPQSSYGLKLITIRNSGTHPTNITSSLLCKTKELANGLELEIRRNLVRLVDAVEDILVRELQSELHSSSTPG